VNRPPHTIGGDPLSSVVERPKRKKPSGLSPTQRSLKRLREAGWLAYVVEHWNHFAGIRQDLFGFIDIVALNTDESVAGCLLGVQTTAASGADRRKKIEDDEKLTTALHHWLRAGARFEIHGWAERVAEERQRALITRRTLRLPAKKKMSCRVVEARLNPAGEIRWDEQDDD
jgi:hypothetical protein